MDSKSNVRKTGKKDLVVIVITVLLSLAIWGSGFLFLNQPDWGGGVDRPLYNKAVENFFAGKNLYLDSSQPLPEDLRYYNYSPIAVLTVGVLSLLPPVVLYLLHFLAVLAMFFIWKNIFRQNQIDFPAWVTPIWFVFSPFAYDALTLNINVFMALLASSYLLLRSKEGRYSKLGAILTLFLMVSAKPQWATFALLPLTQKKWKDFLQIVGAVAALYLAMLGLATLLTSPQYILDQHLLFVQHLTTFAERFTYWNLPPGPFEYNNSIHQVLIYLLGNVRSGLTWAGYTQLILFAALAVLFARTVFSKQADHPATAGWNYMRWFFIFYCATLLYPPLFFDFSLGLPMFLFLADRGRLQKILIGIPLMFVAFQDTIRTILGMMLGVEYWFPFSFTVTILSLAFLLTIQPREVKQTAEALT